MIQYKEILCKSALVKSNIPEADFVINPYTGCEMACVYCYASFMCRFVDMPQSEWGNFLYPKVNILEVLNKELSSKRRDKTKKIFMSSVTDPYTYSEKKYQLTRGILESLLKHQWEGRVSILSKNPLLLRDLELFQSFPDCQVNMTITSHDNLFSKILDNRAPLVLERIAALETLNKNNIQTSAFIGPIIPQYMNNIDSLEELLIRLKDAGVSDVSVEIMNMAPRGRFVLEAISKELGVQVAQDFQNTLRNRAKVDEVKNKILNLLDKYSLNLKLDEIFEHQEYTKKHQK
ncbi:MAG: radical SAM protein [Brevinema sp.]